MKFRYLFILFFFIFLLFVILYIFFFLAIFLFSILVYSNYYFLLTHILYIQHWTLGKFRISCAYLLRIHMCGLCVYRNEIFFRIETRRRPEYIHIIPGQNYCWYSVCVCVLCVYTYLKRLTKEETEKKGLVKMMIGTIAFSCGPSSSSISDFTALNFFFFFIFLLFSFSFSFYEP